MDLFIFILTINNKQLKINVDDLNNKNDFIQIVNDEVEKNENISIDLKVYFAQPIEKIYDVNSNINEEEYQDLRKIEIYKDYYTNIYYLKKEEFGSNLINDENDINMVIPKEFFIKSKKLHIKTPSIHEVIIGQFIAKINELKLYNSLNCLRMLKNASALNKHKFKDVNDLKGFNKNIKIIDLIGRNEFCNSDFIVKIKINVKVIDNKMFFDHLINQSNQFISLNYVNDNNNMYDKNILFRLKWTKQNKSVESFINEYISYCKNDLILDISEDKIKSLMAINSYISNSLGQKIENEPFNYFNDDFIPFFSFFYVTNFHDNKEDLEIEIILIKTNSSKIKSEEITKFVNLILSLFELINKTILLNDFIKTDKISNKLVPLIKSNQFNSINFERRKESKHDFIIKDEKYVFQLFTPKTNLDLVKERIIYNDQFLIREIFDHLLFMSNTSFKVENSKQFYSTKPLCINLEDDFCLFRFEIFEVVNNLRNEGASFIDYKVKSMRYSLNNSVISRNTNSFKSSNVLASNNRENCIKIMFYGLKCPSDNILNKISEFSNNIIRLVKLVYYYEFYNTLPENYLENSSEKSELNFIKKIDEQSSFEIFISKNEISSLDVDNNINDEINYDISSCIKKTLNDENLKNKILEKYYSIEQLRDKKLLQINEDLWERINDYSLEGNFSIGDFQILDFFNTKVYFIDHLLNYVEPFVDISLNFLNNLIEMFSITKKNSFYKLDYQISRKSLLGENSKNDCILILNSKDCKDFLIFFFVKFSKISNFTLGSMNIVGLKRKWTFDEKADKESDIKEILKNDKNRQFIIEIIKDLSTLSNILYLYPLIPKKENIKRKDSSYDDSFPISNKNIKKKN